MTMPVRPRAAEHGNPSSGDGTAACPAQPRSRSQPDQRQQRGCCCSLLHRPSGLSSTPTHRSCFTLNDCLMGSLHLQRFRGRLSQLSKVLCKYHTSAPVPLCKQHRIFKKITNATRVNIAIVIFNSLYL